MTRGPAALTVIACLGGGACGPDLPARLWRGDHVRYFSRAGDADVCPAIVGELEEHGQVIAGALGIEQALVSYYKFDGLDDFADNADCGGAPGCAPNATVRSPADFDRHELIHAYLAPYGRPPWLLIEGAAVALSCGRYPRPTGSWRDAYIAAHSSPKLYGAGGWLVSYLLDTFGPTRFVKLYRSLQSNATPDQFAELFGAIYGVSLDDAWAGAIDAPLAPTFCPWECGRPALALDGQPHALAPVCGGGSLQLAVDLPEAGAARWRLEGAGQFSVGSCDGSETPAAAVLAGTNGAGGLLAPLGPGRYFITAAIDPGGTTTTLAATVDPAGVLSSFDCASAPALPDDLASLGTLLLFYPSSAPSSTMPRFTRFAAGTDRLGQLLVTSDDAAAPVNLCTSCDTPACPSADLGHTLSTQTTPPGMVLDVPAGAAVTATFYWF